MIQSKPATDAYRQGWDRIFPKAAPPKRHWLDDCDAPMFRADGNGMDHSPFCHCKDKP